MVAYFPALLENGQASRGKRFNAIRLIQLIEADAGGFHASWRWQTGGHPIWAGLMP